MESIFLKFVRQLKHLTELIASLLCIILIVAAGILTYQAFVSLLQDSPDHAVQDALFVIIILEMFYVVRSFVKYGSINVGLVINVGLIASVKAMVFQLEKMSLNLALAFGVIFITLGGVYLIESVYFHKFHRHKIAKKKA